MKIDQPKEWFEKMIAKEGDEEIGAGVMPPAKWSLAATVAAAMPAKSERDRRWIDPEVVPADAGKAGDGMDGTDETANEEGRE